MKDFLEERSRASLSGVEKIVLRRSGRMFYVVFKYNLRKRKRELCFQHFFFF